jgi:homoserine/homoserine lactone efflux protein
MDFNIWLAYVVTEFLLSVTPGPAVLLISSPGMKYGAKTSYFGSLGISTGNLVYFALSAFGLGALIVRASDIFEIIKFLGACYLVFIGLKMVYNTLKRAQHAVDDTPVKPKRSGNAFFNAFVTQISNPKAIIFFVSLLPQFVNPQYNVFYQFSILALTTIVMETMILAFYGWLSAKGSTSLRNNPKIMKWIDRVGGGILVGIGINLFFLKSKTQ